MLRVATLDELLQHKDFEGLVAAYAEECAMAGMPPPKPDLDMYARLEAAGLMRVVLAEQGDELLGFAVVLISTIPHYSQVLGVTESIFVAQKARAGGTGWRLVKKIEQVVASEGAIGLLVSAPVGGRLADALFASPEYRHTNVVFFKRFA